ncbi:MAG: hypothetical protein RL220_1544 [Bacteroidota bacterium]
MQNPFPNYQAIHDELMRTIIEVKDFPQPGISFQDVTPVFEHPALALSMIKCMAAEFSKMQIGGIAGMESRGFLFGMALALELQVPFILLRKKGKLPRKTRHIEYTLEYGTGILEVHESSIRPGQRILIHDDVLATGGTADAAAQLIQSCGGEVCGFSFIMSLDFLGGKKRLDHFGLPVHTFANL